MHKLRPYQEQAVSSIFEEWKTNQSTLVNVPTGGGKTQIFCECIKRNLPGRSLIIVHRSELAAQAAKRLLTFGIEAEIEMADQVASTNLFNRSPVVIATVQTLISGSNEWKRLHRFPATDFQTLIIDECFPAGTLVDGKPIEQIQIGDSIRTHQGFGEVRHVFKRKVTHPLIRLWFGDGSDIACTLNHPIWTPSGFLPANQIFGGDPVLVFEPYEQMPNLRQSREEQTVQRLPMPIRMEQANNIENLREAWRDYEISEAQWHAQPWGSGKGLAVTSGQGVETASENGERDWANRSTKDFSRDFRVAYGGCYPNEDTKRQWLSDLLQGGHWKFDAENRDRGGWELSHAHSEKGSRRKERVIASFTRVVGRQIYQPQGNGEFERLCPDGHVYNLEVSNGNTYFANGILVHNCHHATSKSWRQCIEHFRSNPNLRVCGFTATPDRYDEQALGQVFQSVAVDIEILDLIHEGYLVPVEQQMVAVKGLDFSHIRTTCGDLNGADLSAVMEAEENIQGVVGSSIEIIGNKRTLAFAASVKQAEMMASIFNRHRPGMAAWVCGTTPKEDRRRINLEFDQGKIQVLANVGTHTEGFDSPGVEIVIMGRPTKSRCLYAQCCGRALRPLPGTVEGLESDEERKLAIAASAKPSALIVDYVGVSGSHKLIHTADILGGKVSDEAVERAIKIAKERGKVRMVELLDESENLIRKEAEARRLAEEARKARLLAKVKWSAQQVSPFDVLQISPTKERGWNNGKALSEKQRAFLLRNGIPPDGLSYSHGQQLIGSIIGRMGKNLCTFKQARLLKKHGYETKNLGMGDATKLIDALAKNGWRRPVEPVGVPA